MSPASVPPTSLCDLVVQNFATHPVSLAKVAPLGPSADLHCSPVVYGLGWSICLSRFARGRVPSCVRPSVDVSNFLCVRTRTRSMIFSPWWKKERVADSDISMTTEGSHSLLSRQCHDLYYPRDQAPKVGPLPVHERTAVQCIVDSGTVHRVPCDGDRRHTLEELEIIYVVWTGTQTAKQVTLFHCRNMSAREMVGRLTSDAVFGSNQVRAVCDPVIPHVRQRGTR